MERTKQPQEPSLYRLAYGTAAYRRKKGLPGPFFDLFAVTIFVLGLGGYLLS